MTNISKRLRPLRPLAFAAALAAAFGACDEQLSGGIACPALCPSQQLDFQEDTLFAVELDSSIAGYPAFGTEPGFFIANFGDTLETAAAMRFDSLPKFFRHPAAPTEDSLISQVDSGARLKLSIVRGDTLALATTIEVYDIDMGGVEDNDPDIVATAFTADRLLGSRTVPADSLRDTVSVPIDPEFILAKVLDTFPNNRIRLGVRVANSGNPQLKVISTNGLGAPQLIFRPSADTAVDEFRNEPFSRAPGDPFLSADQADYLVVLKEAAPPPPDVFRVGGIPARRVYLRFNIPPAILDSSNVVRATLLLTQRPNEFSPAADDTVGLGHFGVVAGATVTDLTRALLFLQGNPDTLHVLPTEGGLRQFEMIDWVRAWRGTKVEKTPRAIGLKIATEGENAAQVDFYSTEAGFLELRPRLRITYLPRNRGPLP